MIARERTLAPHTQIPDDLEPKDIVVVVLPASTRHLQAVSHDDGLSHVVAAVDGVDLPDSPSA